MTRRLITLDLTLAEYRELRWALFGREEAQKALKIKRKAETAGRVFKKVTDAWEAKGGEGRGLDTRMKVE